MTSRYTWCTLSKLQWGPNEHEKGELWTIEKLHNVQNMVELNNMAEIRENIKGITVRPLFDAVPVSNFILCILHIVIGIGNDPIDTLVEWIEERVEKLMPKEISAKNAVIYAEAKLELA